MELQGRGVIVTGGGSGIGAGLCRHFAAQGARVAVIDRDEAGAKAVADEIGGLALVGDVADPDTMPRLTAVAEESFGQLSIVVLNAGRTCRQSGVDELDLDDYRSLNAVNVDGVVYGLCAAVPALRRAGGGLVVATASLAGLTAIPRNPLYTLTKHAVVGYVRAAGARLAAEGIRVCAVCPGYTDTPILGDRRALFDGFPLMSVDDIVAAVQGIVERGKGGEAWYVQPGRESAPYKFRGIPGPAGSAPPPAGALVDVREQ